MGCPNNPGHLHLMPARATAGRRLHTSCSQGVGDLLQGQGASLVRLLDKGQHPGRASLCAPSLHGVGGTRLRRRACHQAGVAEPDAPHLGRGKRDLGQAEIVRASSSATAARM